jgi:hypothetical protein
MSFSSSWNLFLNGLKQCLWLVVGIYFEWNETMFFFAGRWNLF